VATWGSRGQKTSKKRKERQKNEKEKRGKKDAFALWFLCSETQYQVSFSSRRDSSRVRDRLKGVKAVYSTNYAFVAVLQDGSVETWGSPSTYICIPV